MAIILSFWASVFLYYRLKSDRIMQKNIINWTARSRAGDVNSCFRLIRAVWLVGYQSSVRQFAEEAARIGTFEQYLQEIDDLADQGLPLQMLLLEVAASFDNTRSKVVLAENFLQMGVQTDKAQALLISAMLDGDQTACHLLAEHWVYQARQTSDLANKNSYASLIEDCLAIKKSQEHLASIPEPIWQPRLSIAEV
jgi:hypothetical protein